MSDAEFDRRLAEMEADIWRRAAEEQAREQAAALAEGERRYRQYCDRMGLRVPAGEPVPAALARLWMPKGG